MNSLPNVATSTSRPSISRFSSSTLTSVAASAVSSLPTPIGSLLSIVVSSLLPTSNNSTSDSQSDQYNSLHLMNSSEFNPRLHQHQQELRHSSSLNQLNSISQTQTQMHLSTHCNACGERVVVEVPSWMTDAMNNSTRYMEGMGGGGLSRNELEEGYHQSSVSWRGTIVSNVIAFANFIKTSQIPFLVGNCVKSFIVFILYLDRLFLLHQRFAVMFSILLEGLVEIEKEVGFFRSLGEGLSVFWEAFIKGTIALARPDPTPYQNQNHQPTSGTTTPYYNSNRPYSPPQTASSSSTNLHSLNFSSFNSNSNPHQHSHHQLYEGTSAPDSPPFQQSLSFTSSSSTSNPQVSSNKQSHLTATPKQQSLRRNATPSLPLLLAKSSSSHLIPQHSFQSSGSLNSHHPTTTTNKVNINTFLTPPTPSSTPVRGSPPPPDYSFITRAPFSSSTTATSGGITSVDSSSSSTSSSTSSTSTALGSIGLSGGGGGIGIGGGITGRRTSVIKRRTKSEEFRSLERAELEAEGSLHSQPHYYVSNMPTSTPSGSFNRRGTREYLEEDQFEGEEGLDLLVEGVGGSVGKGWGGRLAGAVGRGLGR